MFCIYKAKADKDSHLTLPSFLQDMQYKTINQLINPN